jgi:hypothetical protein
MSDHTEFSELEERLRAYGDHPVESALQSQHLTAMATTAAPVRRSSVAHKLRVAGALMGGFFLGSTGLAFAGALPDQAQDIAQEALARVGVEVEGGTVRFQGDDITPCPAPEGGGEWRNHGHYVRSQPEELREAAGESDCGKPLVAVMNKRTAGDNGDVDEARERDECAANGQAIAEANRGRRGRPENAGQPDQAGQPAATGKPECTPAGEGDQGDANDAVIEPEATPAEPEAKPVETPVAPPEQTGDEAGDTQGVQGDTPAVDDDEVSEDDTVPEEGTVPEETPPADPGTEEEAPPED